MLINVDFRLFSPNEAGAYLEPDGDWSASPRYGSLLSVIPGIATSMQIAFPPTRLNRLQSFLVAAEVTCSKGDFPVVTVEATLAAVAGLATAAVAVAVPAVLADAVPALPSAAKGAAQPLNSNALSRRLASATARFRAQ